MPTEALAGWLVADVRLPRVVVWTALLTSPARWSGWLVDHVGARLGSTSE